MSEENVERFDEPCTEYLDKAIKYLNEAMDQVKSLEENADGELKEKLKSLRLNIGYSRSYVGAELEELKQQ